MLSITELLRSIHESREVATIPDCDASIEPVIIDAIDTIVATDVSNLVTGHSYYRDTPEAIEAMYYLLKLGLVLMSGLRLMLSIRTVAATVK